MQHQRVLSEDLKSVNLVQLINARSPLEPVGRCFRGNCFAHDDNSRSLYVYPERAQWWCFGPCDSGGDVVAFLMAADQISYGHAIRKLAVQYGLAPEQATADPVNTVNSNDHKQTYLYGPASVEFQRRKNEQRLKRVLDVDPLDTDQIYELVRRRTISYVDDRELTVGHLAYIGKIADIYRPRTFSMRSLHEDQEPRTLGILMSLPTTIQAHGVLESSDGQIHIEDATQVFNAGHITWCNGEAIYKDLATGTHHASTLHGCSSKGFCLVQIHDSPSPLWVWPREPASVGGRDRPFRYRKSGESKTSLATLESFFIQNSLGGPIPESFTDMSGVTVPINVPESSSNRHSDRMRLIREIDHGVD